MSSTETRPGAERERLLTIGEVAERLAVSRATAYRLVATGEIPALRLGGPGHSLRVAEPELEAWLYGTPEGTAA